MTYMTYMTSENGWWTAGGSRKIEENNTNCQCVLDVCFRPFDIFGLTTRARGSASACWKLHDASAATTLVTGCDS